MVTGTHPPVQHSLIQGAISLLPRVSLRKEDEALSASWPWAVPTAVCVCASVSVHVCSGFCTPMSTRRNVRVPAQLCKTSPGEQAPPAPSGRSSHTENSAE